jgi:uncharacterized protein YheU (UPF0270 family)
LLKNSTVALFLVFSGAITLPTLGQGRVCPHLFQDSSTKSKNLTQSYIYRNSQFPLYGDLISMMLAIDIVSHSISVSSTYDLHRVGFALNSLHRRYRVPMRYQEEQGELSPHLWISPSHLKNIVDSVISKSFNDLYGLGYLERSLSVREKTFWDTLQQGINTERVREISSNYKISLMGAQRSEINALKQDTHRSIQDYLFHHLMTALPGGLQEDERTTLSLLTR